MGGGIGGCCRIIWGLLAAWDPRKPKLKAFFVPVGILLLGYIKDFSEEINLVNIYGPYNSKEIFWDRIVAEGTFNLPNLVLVGDLNFTWSTCEIWG